MYYVIGGIFCQIGTLTHIAPVFARSCNPVRPDYNKKWVAYVNVQKTMAVSFKLGPQLHCLH